MVYFKMNKGSLRETKEDHERSLRKAENTTEIGKGDFQNKNLDRYHANNLRTLTSSILFKIR
jgi:hypothetical protein